MSSRMARAVGPAPGAAVRGGVFARCAAVVRRILGAPD
jgi:hypothetical protein